MRDIDESIAKILLCVDEKERLSFSIHRKDNSCVSFREISGKNESDSCCGCAFVSRTDNGCGECSMPMNLYFVIHDYCVSHNCIFKKNINNDKKAE